MFFLNLRMYVLLALLFAFIYAIVSMIAHSLGIESFILYVVIAFVIIGIQYLLGPKLVEWSMRVRYIKEGEQEKLFLMVKEMAEKAKIPMPRVGISSLELPNAFAFGRGIRDSRVCVTEGILRLLNDNELKAVLGHEIAHIKNRDVLTITLLSVIPLILYRIAFHLLFFGGGRSRRSGQNTALIGLAALLFYFITNLLVLYASRIREYFADRGSIVLGNHPKFLASALYKLVYGNARIGREKIRSVEGLKAFFVNDPSRAVKELKELKQIDQDQSGDIDTEELKALRLNAIKPSGADKFFELFSTHPNMLKRIKQLSTYLKT
ncbi:MAG: M48 family metalloprotease [Candidatus Omnitrophica bacterium]|nr:M48 family metalloprotease [Candidatus Omnitrophota bacterium]MBU1925939.1 M48 family metalloprotease [Candidatus Omnitrophota bacterium]